MNYYVLKQLVDPAAMAFILLLSEIYGYFSRKRRARQISNATP
jgi:hypothetical protein